MMTNALEPVNPVKYLAFLRSVIRIASAFSEANAALNAFSLAFVYDLAVLNAYCLDVIAPGLHVLLYRDAVHAHERGRYAAVGPFDKAHQYLPERSGHRQLAPPDFGLFLPRSARPLSLSILKRRDWSHGEVSASIL